MLSRSEASLRIRMVPPFISQNIPIAEDQKKRSLMQNELVFSAKVP